MSDLIENLIMDMCEALPVLSKHRGSIDDGTRRAFYIVCEKLRIAIETPVDAVIRLAFGVGRVSFDPVRFNTDAWDF